MPQPGVHIRTIHPPAEYSPRQIDDAVTVAAQLNRGEFVLAEPPAHPDRQRHPEEPDDA